MELTVNPALAGAGADVRISIPAMGGGSTTSTVTNVFEGAKDAVTDGAKAAASAGGSTLGKAWHAIEGSWVQGSVKEFTEHAAKNGGNTLVNRLKNFFKFDWGASISAQYANKGQAAAQAATQTGAKTGIFGKIGSFLGKIPGASLVKKFAGPLFAIGLQIPAIWTGFKDGGMLEGFKEIGRALLYTGTYTLAAMIGGAVLGVTGGLGLFLIGAGGSYLLNMLVDKVLGKSLAQQKADGEIPSGDGSGEQGAGGAGSSGQHTAQNDPQMKQMADWYQERSRADANLPTMTPFSA